VFALSSRGFLYAELALFALVVCLCFTWARWAKGRQGPDYDPDE
jgi:hypothetical protein